MAARLSITSGRYLLTSLGSRLVICIMNEKIPTAFSSGLNEFVNRLLTQGGAQDKPLTNGMVVLHISTGFIYEQ